MRREGWRNIRCEWESRSELTGGTSRRLNSIPCLVKRKSFQEGPARYRSVMQTYSTSLTPQQYVQQNYQKQCGRRRLPQLRQAHSLEALTITSGMSL